MGSCRGAASAQHRSTTRFLAMNPDQPTGQQSRPLAPIWPLPDDDIQAALHDAYASGDWGRYHGKCCAKLAAELQNYLAVPHVTLCASGTVAVELALRGLGIGPGDEVILAGYDFPGNFRAVEAVGASVVLVDVAELNWNIDPQQVMQAAGANTRAAIISHLHGGLVPMRDLAAWAEKHGIGLVEDACQCPGAMVETRPAGTWGHTGVWSFGGSKLLTAGRGGAVFTRDPRIHQRIKIACQRGNDAFPLSELQAAVLRPQLAKLDSRNLARSLAAEQLARRLGDFATTRPPGIRMLRNSPGDLWPAYYKLGFKFLPDELPRSNRAQFLAAVRAAGVALDEGFRGFTGRASGSGAQPRCRKFGDLRHSEAAASQAMILHHPVLLSDAATLDRVADAICLAANSA